MRCSLGKIRLTTAAARPSSQSLDAKKRDAMPIFKENTKAISEVARAAWPLSFAEGDYNELFQQIGDARLVLIGEASHGTHEFYRERARITRRLIEEHGFSGVAAEADWPDAYRVHRFAQGQGDDPNAERALAG